MAKISVTILTKNSSKYIKQCLEALQSFDEIIILDNGSTDDTLKIAQHYPHVKIVTHDFIGFGPLKNMALTHASNEWILSVDSDEIFSKALVDEILNLSLEKHTIYSILRDNYYGDQHIDGCGWQNDYVQRLFNKNITQFSDKQVHESLIIKPHLTIKKLTHRFKHYSYDNTSHLIDKMQKYSSLYAQEHKNTKTSSPSKAFLRGTYTFIKNYWFQRGFLCGYAGFLISLTNASTTYYKYIKLYEENKKSTDRNIDEN